jgi:segregation and condensation protein B
MRTRTDVLDDRNEETNKSQPEHTDETVRDEEAVDLADAGRVVADNVDAESADVDGTATDSGAVNDVDAKAADDADVAAADEVSAQDEDDPTQLDNVVLALLFASDEPISTRRLSAILSDFAVEDIKKSLRRIKDKLEREYPAVLLERVAGGYSLATNPAYGAYVAKIYSGKRKQKLSKASMETLAIVAYKQPITRADIEQIRGVGCGGVVTTLMERGLIRISGKARILGAPFLYSTSPEFLEYLGLDSLRDLPSIEELEALLEREELAAREAEEGDEAGAHASAEGDDADGDAASADAEDETRPDDSDDVADAAAAAKIETFPALVERERRAAGSSASESTAVDGAAVEGAAPEGTTTTVDSTAVEDEPPESPDGNSPDVSKG